MARFRFKLEPLLKARRRREDEARRAIAGLERRRRELEDALRGQQQWIGAGKRLLADRLLGTVDITALRTQAAATIDHMRRAQRLVIELAGARERWEAARKQLAAAARDRRAIELLRDRRFGEWKRAIQRAEDAALDDLAGRGAIDPLSPGAPLAEPGHRVRPCGTSGTS